MPVYSNHNGKRRPKMTSQQKQQLRNEQAMQDNKISDQQKKDEQLTDMGELGQNQRSCSNEG